MERQFCPLSNREASVSRRLTMYYSRSDFNPCHGLCPLHGGCPPLGGSVMGGSTVYRSQGKQESSFSRQDFCIMYFIYTKGVETT